MSLLALPARHAWRDSDAAQGLQLALGVLAAYGASAALGLPENFWAVMSALIVVRGSPGATFGAGLERIAGTLAGALAGLAGAWVVAHEGGGVVGPLALVAGLAFLTAGRPTLRAAPITALIVLSAAQLAAHSPLRVALLRTLEIGIGVAAGAAVAWTAERLRLAPRPAAECAGLLRQLAGPLAEAAAGRTREPAQREAQATAVRATLRRVGERVHGSRRPADRALLPLSMRLSQDVALLSRALEGAPEEPEGRGLAQAAADALVAAAALLEGRPQPGTREALQALFPREAAATPAKWALNPAQLLQTDLRRLLHVAGAA